MSHDDSISRSAAGLEQLLQRLGTGLSAERVLLEPADATQPAAAEDERVLRAAMALADGSPGVLLAQRSAGSPVFDSTERRLFGQLAAIAETVLSVAGEANRRSQSLDMTRAIAQRASGLSSVAETLAAAVDAVFEHSSYQQVSAVVIDRDAGEQVTVADRSHSLSNRAGMRRPLDEGAVGRAAADGLQGMTGPEQRSTTSFRAARCW